MSDLKIQEFYDQGTNTLTYIVYDNETKDCLVIDPVLDYDSANSRIFTESLDKLTTFIDEYKLKLHYVLETHAHADHLTGASRLVEIFTQAKIGISENITVVQKRFKKIYNLKNLNTEGNQFHQLLKDGQEINAGSIKVKVFSTPGHTPACCCFLIDRHLFTGDLLFMPDFGTGRCDFPDGSARDLYNSLQKKVYPLADEIITYTGHDYCPGGRELKFKCDLKTQKTENIHLKDSTSEQEYVEFREGRDKNLSMPRLLLASIQFNINGGNFLKDEDGKPYLKFPVEY